MGVLAGKVALFTGTGRGVGAAIAKSLAAEEAAVIVTYLESEGARWKSFTPSRIRAGKPYPTAPT